MRNIQKNLNIRQPPISRQPPPILPYPPFLAKMFRPTYISINFEKVKPPFKKGGRGHSNYDWTGYILVYKEKDLCCTLLRVKE